MSDDARDETRSTPMPEPSPTPTTPATSTTPATTGPAAGRHLVDIGHLVMGLALLGLVAVWAVVQGGVVDTDEVRLLLPLPWVLAGAVGLVATTLPGLRRRWQRRAAPHLPDGASEHPEPPR